MRTIARVSARARETGRVKSEAMGSMAAENRFIVFIRLKPLFIFWVGQFVSFILWKNHFLPPFPKENPRQDSRNRQKSFSGIFAQQLAEIAVAWGTGDFESERKRNRRKRRKARRESASVTAAQRRGT